jgi:hypothetical protein
MGFMDKDIKRRWLLLSSLAESKVVCLSELLLYDMGCNGDGGGIIRISTYTGAPTNSDFVSLSPFQAF